MRILVSNDDGYSAPGLEALVASLRGLGELTVVAPESNHSGASNSLTLSRPLTVRTASNGFIVVNGTPSDCVHVALTGLMDVLPDLVVSGINNGANMGDDTLYSGTVAAASEAYLFGVPAMAFSLVEKGWEHIESAARVARQLVERQLARPLTAPVLLNVNIPSRRVALTICKGWKSPAWANATLRSPSCAAPHRMAIPSIGSARWGRPPTRRPEPIFTPFRKAPFPLRLCVWI